MVSSTSSDRFAVIGLTMGIIATVLTGLVHYQITNSPHFDFLIHDAEFYMMLGFVLLITALSIGDLWEGLAAFQHLKEPHRKFAKPLAIAGISLGIVDIFPALLILAIIIETLMLQSAQIGQWITAH